MALPIITTVVEAGLRILDKILPDAGAKAQAQLEFMRLAQSSELKKLELEHEALLAQAEINKAEATSPNLFVSGWRPFIGWSCGIIFVSNYIGVPVLAWLSGVYGWPPPPRLEIGEILPVLLGMLGLGGLRTAEKIKGAA